MTIVEHFTNGGWVDSCRHELDEVQRVDQLTLMGDPVALEVGRCARCGEWVTVKREGAGLFDQFEEVTR